jgi:hypothetical protein
MKFKLNRDYVHVTKEGPSFRFRKNGPPTLVPQRYVSEILAIGGEPIDNDKESAAEVIKAVEESAKAVVDRKAKIVEVVRTLSERNISGDFTAGGKPRKARVEALVGSEVTVDEINEAFNQVHAERQ